MTKKTSIECNLCHASIASDKAGRGVYWAMTGNGSRITFQPMAATEHHLCEKCISDIIQAKEEANELA